MRSCRFPIGSLCVAILLVASCSYEFRNPAEKLRPGEAHGRVGIAAVAEFEGLGGVSVGLLNSGVAEASRPTGAFTLLELPEGVHTLLFRQGVDRALRRQVLIELGSDGQPEGVAMGDVAIGYTAAVTGTVVAPTMEVMESGQVVDEITGHSAIIGSGGSFYFPALDVGEHRFRAFAQTIGATRQFVGGPLSVTLLDSDQQTVKPIPSLQLRSTSGLGEIQFQFVLLTRVAGIDPARLTVIATNMATGATVSGTANPDGSVLLSQLPEGVYRIEVTAPTDTDLVAPIKMTSVVLKDQPADLGSVYAISQALALEMQLACRSNADCEPGGTCQNGQCSGQVPGTLEYPAENVCDLRPENQCSPDVPCAPWLDVRACMAPVNLGFSVCVPCGGRCTPDGVTILEPDPAQCG